MKKTMSNAHQLSLAILGYMILNADDCGNVKVDSNELAEVFGAKKYHVEYAFNLLLSDSFRSSFAPLSQFFRIVSVYDTEGFGYPFAVLSQRFRTLFAKMGVSKDACYENLKNEVENTLENHKKIEAQTRSCDVVEECNENNIYINNILLDKIRDKDRVIGEGKERGEEITKSTKKSAKKSKVETDYQSVLDIFTECCPSLPVPKMLSDKRKSGIECRLAELKKAYPEHDPMQLVRRICEKVEESDFLSGRSGEWRCSFDWIFCYRGNYLKVIEGNYSNVQQTAPSAPRIDDRTAREDAQAKARREFIAKQQAEEDAYQRQREKEIAGQPIGEDAEIIVKARLQIEELKERWKKLPSDTPPGDVEMIRLADEETISKLQAQITDIRNKARLAYEKSQGIQSITKDN